MFYQTTVKSVTDDGVIDAQGKNLSFIGNKLVRVGDLIWTDGKVVFGHTPIRGGGIFPLEPSGIPVLSDDLRGYVTKNGKYKQYNIAEDDWITNSEKRFLHGEDNFNGEKVIDADITDSGDSLIVTDGIYQDARTLDLTYIHIGLDQRIWNNHFLQADDPKAFEQILGSENFSSDNKPIQIFANDNASESLNLNSFAKDVEVRALLCAEDIMQQDISVDSEYVTPEKLIDIFNYMYRLKNADYLITRDAIALPDEPFIAYTVAHVLTSTVSDNGLEGMIFAATYGYCFPHIQPRLLWLWNSTDTSFNETLPHFGLRKGKTYDIYERKCVPFGLSCIYKISPNNNNTEPVAIRSFGGINSDLTVINDKNFTLIDNIIFSPGGIGDIVNIEDKRHVELLAELETKNLDELMPVGEGFYRMDKFGRLTFYDSMKNKVDENIPVHDDYCHIEIEHATFLAETYRFYFNDKPYLRCKIYTADGKVEDRAMIIGTVEATNPAAYVDEDGNTLAKIYAEQADENGILPPIDGYYIKHDNGTLEPLHFTPLFYQFKNGGYLYGVKGGKLYHKDSTGNIEQVGDGLKNFRLRELKRISKAKK